MCVRLYSVCCMNNVIDASLTLPDKKKAPKTEILLSKVIFVYLVDRDHQFMPMARLFLSLLTPQGI